MARKISQNARNAFQMLQGLGYKPHVAAGLVGNLMQESGWNINTGAVGDGGNSFGSVQWNGPRKRAYKQWAAQNGYPEDGLGSQIAYLDHEMKTTERGAYEKLMGARTVRDAAVAGSRHFWRPGDPRDNNRMRYAEAVMADAIQSGLIGGGGADRMAGASGQDALLQNPVMRGSLPSSQDMVQRGPSRGRITPDMVAQAGTGPDLDAMALQEIASQMQGQKPASDLDAMALREIQAQEANRTASSQPRGFAERAAGYVGDAAQAAGQYVMDSARQFTDSAGRAFGNAVNEYISGGQRIDPNKVDTSQAIGFLEQEPGGEPYVLIPGQDGSPDARLTTKSIMWADYFTQVDPQTGRTVVIKRTPDVEESRGLLNAGRMMGLPTAATVPMGTSAPAPAAMGASAQAARAAQRLDVVPSFGMGGSTMGRVASVGNDSMVTSGPFRRDAGRAVDEIASAKERIAASVGTGTGPINAGDALMTGADNFLKIHFTGGARGPNSKSVSEILWGRVSAKIPPDTMIDVGNTANLLDGFLTQFPNLQNVAKDLGVSKWQAWADDIKASGGKLRWSEVSALRSMIGQAVGKIKGPLGDRAEGQIKQIYGALTDDLGTAAKAAGPEAEAAFKRANDHYRRAKEIEGQALDIIFSAKSPEAAYERFLALGTDKGSRANVRKLRELRNAMPDESWQTVVSTVIRRMGDAGDGFSPARFVTEWTKLSDPAKDVLFKGRKVPQGLAQALDDLVMVSERSKGAEKLLNFSNSGANAINFTTGAATVGAAATMDLMNIAMAGIGLGGARIGAELMTFPPFLRAMRAYIASGGSVGAAKRLTKVIQDNPELLAMPMSGARNTQPIEAQPQPQRQAITP